MRGFLGGVSVGALVAAAGAAIWSLSAPLPPGVDVSGDTPAPILAPREESSAPQERPGADADLVETAPVAPDQSSSTEANPADGINTETADRPDVATEVAPPLTDDSESGSVSEGAPQLQSGQDAPVATGGGGGLSEPTAEGALDLETATANAPQPAEGSDPAISEPAAGVAAPGLETTASDRTPELQTSAPPVLSPDIGSTPDLAPPVDFSTPPPVPPVRSATGESSETAEEEDQRIADLPQASNDAAQTGGASDSQRRIGTPVVPLTDRDDPEGADQTASGVAGQEADLPPFVRNAEASDPAPGLPLMSIILIEEEGSVGAEALEEFPYPLTFAIDPADPEAVARMQARRAAGFEVMLLADLPRSAGPQDAETALPVWFDRLPEVVGILEGVDSGVQGNRPLADQVSAIAADLGYGLVLQDNGLNTVQKMALRDGVPAGVVFRDFDGAGQDPRAMRRFLDQAAFRAGQEGSVIMLGRLKPDTISALLIWGLQDRASRVSLVPVSTSLKRGLEPAVQ